MSKTSKIPLYTSDKNDDSAWIGAANNSLFTKPTFFTATTTGITGLTSSKGMFISTGRHVMLSIELVGTKVGTGATVQTPLFPVMKTLIRLENIGDCRIDENGLIALPNFSHSGSLLLTGEVVEA